MSSFTNIEIYIVGDSETGKTCFFSQYMYKQYFKSYNTTLSPELGQKIIDLNEDSISIKIWDDVRKI